MEVIKIFSGIFFETHRAKYKRKNFFLEFFFKGYIDL